MQDRNDLLQKLVLHAKENGFIYQGSEIYGGLANSWDYGPLGHLLKTNLKNLWIKSFIQSEPNNVMIDSSILLNSNVWKASGHIGNFHDPLTDCKKCKSRYRADKIIEEQLDMQVEGKSYEEIETILKGVKCPKCNATDFTPIRQFELMFKTSQGVISEAGNEIYLRPETAQGIFINFKNVQRSMRLKVPLGIGQIGKSFRNEITAGNFIFRTKEFEQMELEFFVKEEESMKAFDYYVNKAYDFISSLGIDKDLLRKKQHAKEELSHYSRATTDIEFNFSFGWGELMGIAHRGDYDLTQHAKHSGQDLNYLDPVTNQKYVPNVIEPSVGVERLILAILSASYKEEAVGEETRINLKLPFALAPYKIAVLPLTNKQNEKALKLSNKLKENYSVSFDSSSSIGKRYRRQDSIGTPFCITVDYDTENDKMVTIRNRNTMKQERIAISKIDKYIKTNLGEI